MLSWKAVYNDGKELPQYNADGTTNKYPDIDRNKLEFFEMWDGDKLIFKLHMEPEHRLIVRQRHISKMTFKGNTLNSSFVWLVGHQWTDNGKNHQSLAWIFPDGHVELTGRFKNEPFGELTKIMDCET